jgi:hypothetical protein
MKARSHLLQLWPLILLLLAFVSIWMIPDYRYGREWHLRHQQLLDFQSAIKPILQSDPNFRFVSMGANTGGRSGFLGGFVGSTNDLEKLRTVYSITLSNHPARVAFHVKIDEEPFR